MKFSMPATRSKTHAIPTLRFEDQQLTSFSGLVVFQLLIDRLQLKTRLRRCFQHIEVRADFGAPIITLLLIVHLLLGYREWRHSKYYRNDPMVLRLLGLRRMPDVATISRTLSTVDARAVDELHQLNRNVVLERAIALALKRVTLDFDGSVLGTNRRAEGTAVGFNRKKKGQRSYYPLFCTIAQTAQVFDVLHRSGNVHDSNGALLFIDSCIKRVRAALPDAVIEARLDSAFFSDEIVGALEAAGVEYSISVPFERFTELKKHIEDNVLWQRLDGLCTFFETDWKPSSWSLGRRFIFVRQSVAVQQKGPIQLDLFQPYVNGFEFKVVLSNKTNRPAHVVAFHNGRGSQEGIFAELKTDNQLDYVPARNWNANRVWLLSVLIAHNMARELQMITNPPARTTTVKRPALWCFERMNTLRQRIIQRAGRLIRPKGKLTLSMNANDSVKTELLRYLQGLGHSI